MFEITVKAYVGCELPEVRGVAREKSHQYNKLTQIWILYLCVFVRVCEQAGSHAYSSDQLLRYLMMCWGGETLISPLALHSQTE